MKGNLAILFFLGMLSCSLETAGLGSWEDSSVLPDAADDQVAEFAEDSEFAEDFSDYIEFGEISDEDVAPDALTPDAEDSADGGAEDGDEDDGAGDPCAPPEIPTDGLYLFFCFRDDITSEMVMWRWVERDWGPTVIWETEPGCRVANSRTLFCFVETYRDATYRFNILMPDLVVAELCGGSLPPCWSCGPGLSTPLGAPRIWLHGVPLPISSEGNGAGGCNHSFSIPDL